MIIYKTTNLINNKIYIGQDSKNNSNYFGSGYFINRALKKYGKENFKKEILEFCKTKEELNKREEFWIEFYNSTDIKIGYNLSKKAFGIRKGFKHTEESKLKMSKAKRGKVITEETKQKMSLAGKGKHFQSEKHKLIRQQVLKGNKYLLGYKYTEEQKERRNKASLLLSEEQAREIMDLLNNTKLTITETSQKLNIKIDFINSIKSNKSSYNKYYNLYFKDNPNHLKGFKYSKQQIEEIINLLKENKLSQIEISKKLNVDLNLIYKIKYNKSIYNEIYNIKI